MVTKSNLTREHIVQKKPKESPVIGKTDNKKVRLKTVCINQDAVVVLEGEAMVSPPR